MSRGEFLLHKFMNIHIDWLVGNWNVKGWIWQDSICFCIQYQLEPFQSVPSLIVLHEPTAKADHAELKQIGHHDYLVLFVSGVC